MKLMIIIGSVREGRAADKVATWVMSQLRQDADLDIDLADLKEVDLPFFNEAVTPDAANGQFQNPKGTAWAKRVSEADAFIFLVAEYNHGPTAVLKNAIDWVYDGWLNKPVGFVSYSGGLMGGSRATEQLKPIVMSVKLHPINAPVVIPRVGQAFDNKGQLLNPAPNDSLKNMLGELKDLQIRLLDLRKIAN